MSYIVILMSFTAIFPSIGYDPTQYYACVQKHPNRSLSLVYDCPWGQLQASNFPEINRRQWR